MPTTYPHRPRALHAVRPTVHAERTTRLPRTGRRSTLAVLLTAARRARRLLVAVDPWAADDPTCDTAHAYAAYAPGGLVADLMPTVGIDPDRIARARAAGPAYQARHRGTGRLH